MLPEDGFKWVDSTFQFNKLFIENYNENSDKRYFLKLDFQYPEKLGILHNGLIFLPERMKFEKVLANLQDKKEYVTQIRNLKQAPNHGFLLKKVHRVTKFNQKAFLKLYLDINTFLWFWKRFFQVDK